MAGIVSRIASAVLVTALAAGVGAVGGRQSYQALSASLDRRDKPTPETISAKAAPALVRELKPIVTNLSDPNIWVRLEAAIVTDPGLADLDSLVAAITTDAIAYLRTLSVADLAGAEGLRHLRADLTERASVRSNKRVREFVVETLVVQ